MDSNSDSPRRETGSKRAADSVRIRLATREDVSRVAQFNRLLAQESEGRDLDLTTLRLGVTRALEHPELCRYYVAESSSGQLVGQTMVTYEVTDWRDGIVHWLQSVFVEPAWRGQGVFKKLYGHVLNEARQSGIARGVRLYVEKDNARAIKTYERLGMQRAHFYLYEAEV